MGKDDGWEVVRRRTGSTAKQAYKELVASQKLSIPIVALPFEALRPEDPNKEKLKAKRKEKKKRAKARAREGEASDEDDDEDDGTDQANTSGAGKTPGKAGSATSKAKAAAVPSAGTVAKGVAEVSWLFRWLYALIAWIKVLLGLQKAARPKPKPKAAVQAPASKSAEPAKPSAPASVTPAAPATKPAAAAAAAPAPAAAKAGIATAAATASTAAPATKSRTPATSAAPPTPAAAAAVPAKPAAQSKAAVVPQAAATAQPTAPPATTPAPPRPAANAKASGEEAGPKPQAPKKPTPPPPSGPASKCDKEWARGRFVVCELPSAHSDVVASVAVAGKLGLSGGYDGALKVWAMRPGAAPARVKTLTGHSGRVEAVCADAGAGRAASSGRDSSLKVWDLGATSGSDAGASARELCNHYVYESVRCMAVDWASQPVVAALGAKSGNTSLYTLETGRKLGVLKGHCDEVTAVKWGSAAGGHPSLLFTGCAGGEVRVWDTRAPAQPAVMAALHGIRGRVCSLAASQQCLYVGDYSSTIKVFDIRNLSAANGNGAVPPARRLPNAPRFAGDACPVAALHVDAARGVVLSSSIAWWTNKWEVLEEAPESCATPAALINVHAVDGGEHEYMTTVRLGEGIATCMACEGDMSLVGSASGSLFTLTLVRGPSNSKSVSPGEGAREVEGLEVGCLELSDDEESEEESDDEDEE